MFSLPSSTRFSPRSLGAGGRPLECGSSSQSPSGHHLVTPGCFQHNFDFGEGRAFSVFGLGVFVNNILSVLPAERKGVGSGASNSGSSSHLILHATGVGTALGWQEQPLFPDARH